MSKPLTKPVQPIREVVALFDEVNDIENAVNALKSHGIGRQDISVVADANTVEKKLGHIYKKVADLEDDPNAPRVVYVSPQEVHIAEGALIGAPLYIAATVATGLVVASGGTLLAALLTATAAGTGGAILGGLFARLLDNYSNDYLHKHIERGGILLWVQVHDAKQEGEVMEILRNHSAHDVHAHTLRV